MTVQEEERAGRQATATASTKSSGKADDRRMRRLELLAGRRLTATGSPIAATLSRVPFVALIILLLAGGIVGVLWLNTMSDATGLRASKSRLAQMDLDTDIEAVRKDIAALKDPARLDAQARALGLVPPPGDAAMIVIDNAGNGTVIGTPTPVAGPPQTASAATTAAGVPAAALAPPTVADPAKLSAAPAATAAPKVETTAVPRSVAPAKTAQASPVRGETTQPRPTQPSRTRGSPAQAKSNAAKPITTTPATSGAGQ